MSVHGLLRLRRITSSGAFIPEIDGLRFVAIMSVLFYHLRGYLLEKGGPFAGDPPAIVNRPPANTWPALTINA